MLFVLAKLQRVHELIQVLSRPIAARAAQAAAAQIERLVVDGFRSSTDPYGSPWEPLRLRRGKPLLDTGRLRSSISARALGTSRVRVGTNVAYAKTHQYGATITAGSGKMLAFRGKGRKSKTIFAKSVTIPARPFLPNPARIPAKWKKSISFAMEKSILRQLKMRR